MSVQKTRTYSVSEQEIGGCEHHSHFWDDAISVRESHHRHPKGRKLIGSDFFFQKVIKKLS